MKLELDNLARFMKLAVAYKVYIYFFHLFYLLIHFHFK